MITVALLRDLEKQVTAGEISYSRMVEIINEQLGYNAKWINDEGIEKSVKELIEGFGPKYNEALDLLSEGAKHYRDTYCKQALVQSSRTITDNTLETLADDFAKDRHQEEYDHPAFNPDVAASKQCFKAGFRKAQYYPPLHNADVNGKIIDAVNALYSDLTTDSNYDGTFLDKWLKNYLPKLEKEVCDHYYVPYGGGDHSQTGPFICTKCNHKI